MVSLRRLLHFRQWWLDHKREYLTYLGIKHGTRAFTGPTFAQIDVTNNCNNDCIACWARSPYFGAPADREDLKHFSKEELPYELVIKLLDDLKRMGTQTIRFAGGGEPFMHPRFPEILRHAHDNGFNLEITTNGTLIDRSNAALIVELGVSLLTTSLWAGDADTYAVLHPNKTSETFVRIADSLRWIITNRASSQAPRVLIYNVISNLNFRTIKQMVTFGKELGVNAIYFQMVDPVPGVTECLLLKPEEQVELAGAVKELEAEACSTGCECARQAPLLWGLDEFKRKLEAEGALAGQYDKQAIDSMPCYVGWKFVRITGNGDVNFCLKSDRKPLGSLHKQAFETVWRSTQAQEFRHKALTLTKDHPFFAEVRCYYSCDNREHNLEIAHEIASFYRWEKKVLDTVFRVWYQQR